MKTIGMISIAIAAVCGSVLVLAQGGVIANYKCVSAGEGSPDRMFDCTSFGGGCVAQGSSCLINGQNFSYSHRNNEVEYAYNQCISDAASDCLWSGTVLQTCYEYDVYDAAGCHNWKCSKAFKWVYCWD